MIKNKGFLHSYIGEGMDEMTFNEAKENVNSLISEYKNLEESTKEDNGEEDSKEKE